MQASLKIKVIHTYSEPANTHSPQATSIRHKEARQHIFSLVVMQLHPAHSNSFLHKTLNNSKNLKSKLKLKFRSKPNSVFIQVTTCPLCSRQQISGFDNLPAPSYNSSTVFHSSGSLSTHSLFMHHSSNIDQTSCSGRNILILHSSALLTLPCSLQTALIKWCPSKRFFGVKKLLLCSHKHNGCSLVYVQQRTSEKAA